jgi:hypothetical protein
MIGHARVSVVIPVYNGAKYLRQSIESALAQTHTNLEVIVVNDGSTDGGETASVAAAYGSRIHYVEKANGGVASALNAGISCMTGEFFAWLSHDDIYLPTRLERNIAFYLAADLREGVLFSDYFLIDELGTRLKKIEANHDELLNKPLLALLKEKINGSTILIQRGVFQQSGLFDERLRYTQDYMLWNSIARTRDFLHQNEALVEYRVHKEQGTLKKKAEMVVEGERLWRTILDDRTEMERAQVFGSQKRFFAMMADFLENSPYLRAGAYARARSRDCIRETMVSVVMEVRGDNERLRRAIDSILGQTHGNIDLILVDHHELIGKRGLAGFLGRTDRRVRVVPDDGLTWCRGDYIALADGDSEFLSHKISTQMALMQEHGAVASHTSYFVNFGPEWGGHLGKINAGRFGGFVYPQIISEFPIAMHTVMLHRSILSECLGTPMADEKGQDVLFWVEVALRYRILGIADALSVADWNAGCRALDLAFRLRRVAAVERQIFRDERHAIHHRELAMLHGIKKELEQESIRPCEGNRGPEVQSLIDQSYRNAEACPRWL